MERLNGSMIWRVGKGGHGFKLTSAVAKIRNKIQLQPSRDLVTAPIAKNEAQRLKQIFPAIYRSAFTFPSTKPPRTV